jgi:hypothetical protein
MQQMIHQSACYNGAIELAVPKDAVEDTCPVDFTLNELRYSLSGIEHLVAAHRTGN